MSYCFRWPYCQNRGASAKITIRINISRSDTPRLGGGCGGGGVLFVRAMVIGSCVLCMEKGKDFEYCGIGYSGWWADIHIKSSMPTLFCLFVTY